MTIKRVGQIVFVPTVNSSAAKAELTLEDIDSQVRAEVEEMYAAMKQAPGGRFRLTFETKADMLQYLHQATAYAKLREVDGKAAPIRVRRSPTPEKSLKEVGLSNDTTMDIRVTDVPADGTDEVRQATAVANSTAIQGVAAVETAAKPATTRRTRK